jgi:dihydroneopterin aldolase
MAASISSGSGEGACSQVDPWSDEALAETERPGKSAGTRRVFVRELELLGSVGVYEHEHRYEQRVLVSVELQVQDDYDGTSDQLSAVYDYDLAIRAVKGAVDSGHFNLIETLAERIAQSCLADRRVLQVRVRVEKPDLLAACAGVGIEIERSRPTR